MKLNLIFSLLLLVAAFAHSASNDCSPSDNSDTATICSSSVLPAIDTEFSEHPDEATPTNAPSLSADGNHAATAPVETRLEPEPLTPSVSSPQATPSQSPSPAQATSSKEAYGAVARDLENIQNYVGITLLILAPFMPAMVLGYRVNTHRVAFAHHMEVGVYFLSFAFLLFGMIFNAMMESQALKWVGYGAMFVALYGLLVLWGYQRRLSSGLISGTLLFVTKLLFMTLGLLAVLLIILVQTVLELMAARKFAQKDYVPSAGYGVASYKVGKTGKSVATGWEKYVNGASIPAVVERLPEVGFSGFLAQGMKGWLTSR